MLEHIIENNTEETVIKVIGVGGAGGNMINHIIEKTAEKSTTIQFYAVNSLHNILESNKAPNKLFIGKSVTDETRTAETSKKAAEQHRAEISEMVADADLVIILAGMGGADGSGVSSIVAEIAQNVGAKVMAFVTKPFRFEGMARSKIAIQSIETLKNNVDTLLAFNNEDIFNELPPKTPLSDAFKIADQTAYNLVSSLDSGFKQNAMINIDFTDFVKVLEKGKNAQFGIGLGEGENRAEKAVKALFNQPFFDATLLKNSKGLLINIQSNDDLELIELDTVMQLVTEQVPENTKLLLGTSFDEKLNGKLKVSFLTTY